MSQRNDTTTLIATLLVTVGLLGGGVWLFTQQSQLNLGSLLPGSSQGDEPAAESNAVKQPNRPEYNTFAQVEGVPSGAFAYGGSTTWAPMRGGVDPAIQTVWPQFKLQYTSPTTGTPGSSTGIRMLLNDQLAFAQSSRPLKSAEYEQAEQQGFTLKEIPVALEGIAIAVHPSLQVPGLTLAQLKDIYTGNLTNWNQVGGPNLKITPYSRRLETGGTVEFFIDNVLDGEQLGSNVSSVPTTTAALRQISRDPGGLYYASAPEVVPQCTVKSLPLAKKTAGKFIPPYQPPFVPLSQCPGQRNQLNNAVFRSGDYPITRSLFTIVKANGTAEQRAGEAYADLLLSQQGQDLIVKAGFVQIR